MVMKRAFRDEWVALNDRSSDFSPVVEKLMKLPVED